MGKVKIRVVGDETVEQEQKEEQKKRREEKVREGKKAQIKGVGLGGGQRINTVGISEEEITKELEGKGVSETTEVSEEAETPKKTKKSRKAEARIRSKRHQENSSQVAKKTAYPIGAGIEILRKFKKSNFDETVELHINVKEKGVSGQVTLPHGTGKKLRIKVADDALISQVEQGKIDFDVLVATPDMMPKLAKVARVLGPRGLMPNPKNGTISDKPEQVIEKLSAGQISFKTEAQAPIIHMSVGKLSFKDEQLSENIQLVLNAVGSQKINNVVLKSTMSPAIPIQA
jgi:large subunit ribosomal protein L1